MSGVYDTGVLIAADRNDRNVWVDHRARLEAGLVPVTTALATPLSKNTQDRLTRHR